MNQDRRKTKLSAKTVRKLIIILVAVAVIITVGALYLRSRVKSEFGSQNDTEVSTATVTKGSISTSIYSSGRLTDDDVEKIEIPDGVELTEIKVNAGDKVAVGDVLASVKLDTVMTAMSDISSELSTLDAKLASASTETATNYISSSVSGRVKKIYASVGDSVASVMEDNGALMLLSLDGYMALDIDNNTISKGDSVIVTTSAGTNYDGTVDNVLDGKATILVTDNGPALGDTATVSSADGSTLGSGELYINNELKVVGYTGTVSVLSVSENSRVYSGTTLISLSDTAATSSYASLLREREELEDTLQQLISIYSAGAFCSTIDGTVQVINAVDDDTKSSSSVDTTDGQYISVSPDKTMSLSVSVDESDILSVELGQSATVTVDALDDQSFEGSVTSIDKAGTSSSGVTVYTAKISIDKADGMLSGMSASATIKIEGVDDALIIPADALNKTSSSYYVYTSYNESEGTLGDMVEVTVGISNSNYVEILSGLSEGDTVYYIEKEDDSNGFMMPGSDFGGGMPSGDFGGGGGDFGGGQGGGQGGGMPGGGGGQGGGPGM